MQYSEKDKKINDSFYSYFLRHNQDDGWGDKDKYGNFQFLIDITNFTEHPLKGASVLDVGCGTGDFADFLAMRGVNDYTGIDIFQMSVEYANMKYPSAQFVVGDFLTYSFDKTYDYVFSSGALAAVLDTDNYHMMGAFIQKMWSLATVGVAFNFLTREHDKDKDRELFLYDLDEVKRICYEHAPNSRLEYVQNKAGDEEEFLQTHIYLLK